jgi:hypothetical protein
MRDCYRERAGGVIAREVLLADAVNLPPTWSDRAGEKKESDVHPSTPHVGAVGANR